MPTSIGKLDAVSTVFNGISDIIICTAPANYATASVPTLAGFLALGDIKLDSTTFSGDAPTTTEVKNEKGSVVVSTSVAGTFKFEFTCLNTSPAMITKFFQAAQIAGAFVAGDVLPSTATMYGLGTKLPILECPIMVTNSAANQTVLYPKASIVSSLVMDSKVLCIKCVVTAQNIDTATLKTVMILSGALNYGA